MTSNRGQSVFVLQQPGTELWEAPAEAFTSSRKGLRSTPQSNLIRTEKKAFRSEKSSGQHFHSNSLSGGFTKFQSKDCNSVNKCPNPIITNSISSSSILNTVSRELSPVRWCDREVDGVYLGRSGWVQVQQRSLDDGRGSHGKNNNGFTLPSQNSFSDLSFNSKFSERRERSRPVNLPLSIKKPPIRESTGKSPEFFQELESASPPSITPIISPPPAFKDDGINVDFSNRSARRPFTCKNSFFQNSKAVADSDDLPPSPKERRGTSSAVWNESVFPLVPTSKHQRHPYQVFQTKSLEEDRTNGAWHDRRFDAASPCTLFGFRSLDDDTKENNTVNISVSSFHKNFGSKEKKRNSDEFDKKEENAAEIVNGNGETDPDRHFLGLQSLSCEGINGSKFLTKGLRQRTRQPSKRRTFLNDTESACTMGSSFDSSSSSSRSSSPSSDGSFNDKNFDKTSSWRINSKQSQPLEYEGSHRRSSRHFYVKRSRSLQLSERKSPSELMFINHSSSRKSWDPMPPDCPPLQTRNKSTERSERFPQRLHQVLVTVNGESIPIVASCDQSLKSLNKITTSEAEQKKLIKEAEKEARVISEFVNGTRSRTAARNLLKHRYFNQSIGGGIAELVEDNAYPKTEYSYNFPVTEDQRFRDKPIPQEDITCDGGSFRSKSQFYPSNSDLRNPTAVHSKPLTSFFQTSDRSGSGIPFPKHSDQRCVERVEKKEASKSCVTFSGQTNNYHSKRTGHQPNRSFDQACSNSRIQKKSFWAPKQESKKVKKQNSEKFEGDSVRRDPSQSLSVDKKTAEEWNPGGNTFEESSSVSSSSSDEFFHQDSGAKLKKSKRILETYGLVKDDDLGTKSKMLQKVFHSRAGSIPESDDCISMAVDQRSLSLPRSFLSERCGLNYFYQRDLLPGKQQSVDTSSEVCGENPKNSQSSRTAPSTPVRDLRNGRSIKSLNEIQCIRSSCTSLFEEPRSLKPRRITQKVISGKIDPSGLSLNERDTFLIYKEPLKISDISSQTILQKLKKKFFLKYLKTKGNLKSKEEGTGSKLEDEDFGKSSEILSLETGLISELQTLENVDGHGPSLGFAKGKSVENKIFKNDKYDSYDSGIQMGNRGNVDSSESQDTDLQEDLDSWLEAGRREVRAPENFCRPQSEIFNQVLIDKFKADLQWRTRVKKHSNGKGVRRTNSDLGGQRLFNWDVKNNCGRFGLYSSPIRGPHGKTICRPSSPEDSETFNKFFRPPLRRSLSQPLGLNELPSFVRRRSSTLKCCALSEDEKNPLRRNSEDEFISDSESSVASLKERKKSFDFALEEREEAAVLAEAVWDHVAMESCELPFRAGDVIEVLDTRDRDWWWGTTKENSGYFPSAFVRLRVSQEDTVEDCLAAMAKGKNPSNQRRRGKSVSLLSNDQVRSSIVKELLNTERDFVKILRDVKEGYVTQCKKRTDMFTPAQISTIFSNLEDLLVFQEKFLKDLEAKIDLEFPYKSCVGEVFLINDSGFRMYSEYCNSHPMAIAILQDMYQKNNYCTFFETCRLKQSLIEIPLDGYLLTPVQRICKYPLQLAELFKYTKPDHPDYRNVEEALKTMKGVATLINERKRKMESLEKLAAWQQRVEGWEGEDLIEISSQLIHQGDVVRITSGMWTTNITLFLFDHQIIYCKKDLLKRNVYIYKGRFFLDASVVVDVPDGKNQQLGVTIKYGLKISSNSKDKWLLFCCRSSEEKAKWLEALAEEKKIVAQDKEGDLELSPSVKQLAKLAARTKKCPPCKLRGKHEETDEKLKEDDRLSFSLSEEEAEDTADSLDIKPPQAITHRKPRHKKDKFSYRDSKRLHSHKDLSSHRKSHHQSSTDRRRQHKEVDRIRDKESLHSREKEHREKRLSHRERRLQREKSEHEHFREIRLTREHYYKSEGKLDERSNQERITIRDLTIEDPQKADQILQDLRGKLIDKRNIREGKSYSLEKYDEPERKKIKRDRKQTEILSESPINETHKERVERLEREERKAKLLEADREMAKRKEVSRRELEARRERHNIEKEKDRMLKEIAKKHKMDEQRDKIESRTHDIVVMSDNSEAEDSEESAASTVSSDSDEDDDDDDEDDNDNENDDEDDDMDERTENSDNEETDDEELLNEKTPESVPPLEKSPVQSDIEVEDERESGEEPEKVAEKNTENNEKSVNDSPKSEEAKDVLPPYLPAIQGCRSVEEFQCLNRIEEGTYGVVYRARDKRTNDIVALKRLKMEKEKDGFPITSLREINTLLKAQHPNIVTVREIVVGSNMDKIFIVMDYVEHDLKSLMETMKQKKQVFVAGEVKCLMQQLLRAVAHLHDNWILHRDLKTSNLLLSHKGVLKVGDFGLAREYGSPLKIYTPVVVTLWYRAPELLLQSKEYSTAIDMWSVGCIFGELLQMKALFSGETEMGQLNKIFKALGTPSEKIWPGYNKLPATQKVTFAEYPVNQLRNRFGTILSELGIDLINKFLTYDPVQRITAEDALKHDYFKEAPLPIDPAMFPTWPAKSEQGHKKINNSPKPPSGGKEYKQLGDTDDDVSASGFHMGVVERRVNAIGPGFSLKF